MQFGDYLLKRLANLQNLQNDSKTSNGSSTGASSGTSIFSSASAEELANIDFEELLSTQLTGTENQESLNTILKGFLELEDVQKTADADGDGALTAEEAQTYVQSLVGKDGNDGTFSMADIDAVMEEMGIDLEAVVNETLDEALDELKEEDKTEETEEKDKTEETDKTKEKDKTEETKSKDDEKKTEESKASQQPSSTGSTGSAGGSSGSGGVSSPSSSGSVKKTDTASDGETPEEIQAQIDEKNGEIDDIESQAEQDIQEQEDAKKEAMEAAGVSEKEYEEYQKKEQELEKNIQETEDQITEQDEAISDAESSIASNENYISSIDAQISANKSMLSGISGDDENSQSRISDINSKISALESEKADKEAENEKLEAEKEKAEQKKAELEQKKQDYETQKQELLNETLNNSENFGKGIPSSEVSKIKENIAKYDTKISEIRSQKESDVAAVRSDIQNLQVKLKDAQEKEKRNEFLRENSANQGQSILDLADSFDGKTQDEMREIMRAAGYQFDDGAWCADFVSYIAGQTIGEENLPDWYKNCNRAYCPDIQSKAGANGATVSVSEAQPGDAILFDWNGDGSADHIGYVVSVNDDGTVNTIEGNTGGDRSGSQVAYKTRNPGNILTCVKLT